MSVFVNDRQIFGGGQTEQEAKTATIISVFEYIVANRLEIDCEKIWIGNHAKDKKPETEKKRWTDKLKGEESTFE